MTVEFAQDEAADGNDATVLVATVSELCAIAQDAPSDAIERCEAVIRRFVDRCGDRRQRVSSAMALYLATMKRMSPGPAKSFVDETLSGVLRTVQGEGRYDTESRGRNAFVA